MTNNFQDIEDSLPIFLSNDSQLPEVGRNPENFGFLQSNFSNQLFKHCNTKADYEKLEENLIRAFSCQSYTPEYLFNPLTLLCFIINPITRKKKKIRIVWDSCSNITILEENVAKILKLHGPNVDISFSGTGGKCQRFEGQKDVQFLLQSLDGKFITPKLIQAATLPKVSAGFERIKTDPKNYDYLKDITGFTEKLPMSEKDFKKFGRISLLLGVPYESHYGAQSKVLGPDLGDPVAYSTPLGWCLSASMRKEPTSCQNMLGQECNFFDVDENGDVICKEDEESSKFYPDLTQFWRLDLVGIFDCPTMNNDVTYEENLARELLLKNTRYCKESKTYFTCLPWRSHEIQETNKARALASTYQWIRKLEKKNPVMLENWIKAYQYFVDNGFAVKVPEEDMKKENHHHYLQTFPVDQSHKPDHPVRVVFAANQKQKISNKSLNDHLLPGPNQIQDLVLMVLRFRSYFYVFGLDLTRMFLRFKLHEPQQDYLRFFLVKRNKEGKIELDSYRATGLAFGLCSSPFSSIFLLQEHAKKYLDDEEYSTASNTLINNVYIDDVLIGDSTENGLIDQVKKVKFILEEASLPSHKYVSNSKAALQEFPKELLHSKETVSMLGSIWNTTEDVLTFNLIKPPRSFDLSNSVKAR